MPQDKSRLIELISPDRIEQRIVELAHRISEDFASRMETDAKPLVMLGVLKGSFMFLADLARHLSIPVEIEFVSINSYGNRLESSGTVELYLPPSVDLAGRRVLVVEDIVDTGRSLVKLLEHLHTFRTKEIRLCSLLDKPDARVVDLTVDYVGFEIPLKFVVGYGLDAAQQYRALAGIYELETT